MGGCVEVYLRGAANIEFKQQFTALFSLPHSALRLHPHTLSQSPTFITKMQFKFSSLLVAVLAACRTYCLQQEWMELY